MWGVRGSEKRREGGKGFLLGSGRRRKEGRCGRKWEGNVERREESVASSGQGKEEGGKEVWEEGKGRKGWKEFSVDDGKGRKEGKDAGKEWAGKNGRKVVC